MIQSSEAKSAAQDATAVKKYSKPLNCGPSQIRGLSFLAPCEAAANLSTCGQRGCLCFSLSLSHGLWAVASHVFQDLYT